MPFRKKAVKAAIKQSIVRLENYEPYKYKQSILYNQQLTGVMTKLNMSIAEHIYSDHVSIENGSYPKFVEKKPCLRKQFHY